MEGSRCCLTHGCTGTKYYQNNLCREDTIGASQTSSKMLTIKLFNGLQNVLRKKKTMSSHSIKKPQYKQSEVESRGNAAAILSLQMTCGTAPLCGCNWLGRAMCCFDMPSPSEVEAAGGCSFTLLCRWL